MFSAGSGIGSDELFQLLLPKIFAAVAKSGIPRKYGLPWKPWSIWQPPLASCLPAAVQRAAESSQAAALHNCQSLWKRPQLLRINQRLCSTSEVKLLPNISNPWFRCLTRRVRSAVSAPGSSSSSRIPTWVPEDSTLTWPHSCSSCTTNSCNRQGFYNSSKLSPISISIRISMARNP